MPHDAQVTDLLQAVGQLVRRVRAAGASHELSLTESAVLGRLSREGPATVADLARAESMKPQSMGSTVAALEQAGLVERSPHPTDGRQILIKLTGKGTALRTSVTTAKHAWLTQAVTQLQPAEREVLFQAARIIRGLAQK